MLPFLRTKTSIPPARPGQVPRARLIDQMQTGMQRALTLVVAPAGYGKTTLAAAWAASARVPVAWLTLQAADRPPVRFLSYMIQALQQVSTRTGQTSLALLAGGLPENSGDSIEGALSALVNDLAELDREIGLVLDDYHCVDNPEIGALLRFLLENRPAMFHLAITSRTAPAFPLARLRALDQVAEIGADDLRFQPGEMRDFLKDCMGMHLAPPDLERLEHSTEGWAVGLQLAALAHQSQVKEFSKRSRWTMWRT